MSTYLAISWSISRAKDTYGYNVCRLDDTTSGERFSCCGGGYDMLGTVFGDWLQATHNARCNSLAIDAIGATNCPDEGTFLDVPGFYGMHRNSETDTVSLDGACRIESMVKIAEAIGLTVERTHNRRGQTTGFIVDKAA